MFRTASRTVLRSAAPRSIPRAPLSRRFLSTAPPTQTSRSWKSTAARWGLAFGLIYYYNTSNVFAEEPAYMPPVPETEHETETLPTIESVTANRQQRESRLQPQPAAPSQSIADPPATTGSLEEAGAAPGSPQELEEEADQQGAFNPETGEINWDCPCLGGMAHGPCGEEFKAAFSCFVYSKEEPKGMDCIEKFKGMQDCFRQHPDIYGAELDDDDDVTADVDSASAESAPATQGRDVPASEPPSLANMDSPQHGRGEKVADIKPHHEPSPEHDIRGKQERAKAASEQVDRDHGVQSESDAVVPKAAHDAR